MEPSFFFFFNVLKQVPICFSCLGERCNAVLFSVQLKNEDEQIRTQFSGSWWIHLLPGCSYFLSWEVIPPTSTVFMLECGSNMECKNKLFWMLLLWAFQQHAASYFWYLSEREKQRKRYKRYKIHDFCKSIFPSTCFRQLKDRKH